MAGLATKHNDPNASLGWGEHIGYGTGGFAFNMINGIIGSFLTMYFTSAVGLNSGIISSIFAVSKIFDGVSDLVVGRLVDKTKSEFGKGRTWLLRMCIPFAITTMLLFYVPTNIPSMAQYVYVFLMYNIVNAVCLTGMLSNAISIAQFAIMFVTPLFMKKIGKEKVYTFGMLVMAFGFALTGLSGGNSIVMIISNVLKGCGVGMAGGMALGMVGDTITYGKLKTGIDTVGMGNAGISAAQKIGLGLGQAVFGWGLTAAGMDGTLDAQGIAQPESVTTAVNFMYGWLPAIMAGVMFILFLLFYRCEREVEKLQNAQ